tara:strand:+ start:1588 stop:2940 length:1353 start_codon:yes stop_codon:yes gene_type:complete
MEDILSELGFDYEEIMNVDSDYFSGIFNAFKTGSTTIYTDNTTEYYVKDNSNIVEVRKDSELTTPITRDDFEKLDEDINWDSTTNDIVDRAKEEADEFKASKWGTFFLGCGTSLIFVTYIAIVCANFIYFSKLPINISIGEETIHTFFPIANESSFISKFFSRPVSDRDFGEYRYGTAENIETSSGAKLSRLLIPPVGSSDGSWYLRFPYNLIEFGDYDYENANFLKAHFYARLAWLGRSTAVFYIFCRKICQLIFTGVSRVGNFLKILIAISVIGFVLFGLDLYTIMTKNRDDSGFISNFRYLYNILFNNFSIIAMVTFIIISITQIRFDIQRNFMGIILSILSAFTLDPIVLFIFAFGVGSYALPTQFIATFVLPFNGIVNYDKIRNIIDGIKGSLGIIYAALCLMLAKIYLNDNIFTGMLLVVILYIIVQIVNFIRWMFKSINTKFL